MQEFIPELFDKVMNLVDTGGKYSVLREVSRNPDPISPKMLSRSLQSAYLRIPSHVKSYLEEMADYGLVQKIESNGEILYKPENLSKIVLNEIERTPLIRLRGKKRKSSYCTEEKILLLLLGGSETRKNIYSSLNHSEYIFEAGLRRLKYLNFITKIKHNIQFLKIKEITDKGNLTKWELPVYEILEKEDYVRAKYVREVIRNKSAANLGIKSLLEKGIISEIYEKVTYNLTPEGKAVASSLERILEAVKKSSGIRYDFITDIRKKEFDSEVEQVKRARPAARLEDRVTRVVKSLATRKYETESKRIGNVDLEENWVSILIKKLTK